MLLFFILFRRMRDDMFEVLHNWQKSLLDLCIESTFVNQKKKTYCTLKLQICLKEMHFFLLKTCMIHYDYDEVQHIAS